MTILSMVTHPMSVGFLNGQLRWLAPRGWRLTVLCGDGEWKQPSWVVEVLQVHRVGFSREVSPWADLKAIVRLAGIVRAEGPAVVNAGTPKAGLMGMVSAWLMGVRVRVYTMRGLRLETASGPKGLILRFCERISCWCAHRVVCVSPSLRERAIALGLGRPDKFVVLGAGSSGGVVVSRFEVTPERLERAVCIRAGLGIPEKSPVVGFVGRIVRDKGVVELVSAFEEVSRRIPGAHLMVVGWHEEGDPIPAETRAKIERNTRIHAVGQVRDTAPYLHAMDLLVLPTYREGFPNVVLEAGAAEKPVVATRATGVVDAVVDGVTGLLSEIGDVEGLATNIVRVLEDKDLARRMGKAGRERAARDFQPERIYRELEQLYIELLREKGMVVEVGPEGVTVRESPGKRRWWRGAFGRGDRQDARPLTGAADGKSSPARRGDGSGSV